MLFFVLLISCLATGQVALGQCRPDWHYYDQSCYAFGESKVTFAAAQEICRFYSANLAEIETAGENNFVKEIAKNKTVETTWLGGTDIFDEGNWLWLASGKRIFTFLDWAQNQPDEARTGEDCLALYQPLNYQWTDLPCDSTGNFICEGPPTDE